MINMKDYLYVDYSDDAHQSRFKVSKTPEIDYLITEKRFDEALVQINQLLKTDYSYGNLNLKGIILDNLSDYEKSIEVFNEALNLNQCDEIQLNKANALYDWAKAAFFPEGNYDKALKLIDCGLDALPDNEDPSEFYFLKAEIFEGMDRLEQSHKCYLMAYKEFDKLEEFEAQCDYLHDNSDVLINVVGSNFYDYTPNPGDIVSLLRDEENEHDPDAIAVSVEGKTVGYLANNPYTLMDGVKSASDIKNQIEDNQEAEILFIYLGEYVIAKLR